MKKRSVRKPTVTLDISGKTMLKIPCRRWKTQEKIEFYRRQKQCSIVLPYCKGQAKSKILWLQFASGSKSKNKLCISLLWLDMCSGFLSEINKQMPFSKHSISVFEHIDFVKYLIAVEFMRPEKVVAAHPKSNGIVWTVKVVITAGTAIYACRTHRSGHERKQHFQCQ